MAILLARTTLANGASTTVDTSAATNFVLFCKTGTCGAEIFIDGAAPDGYRTPMNEGAPIVVVAAAKVVITGAGPDGGTAEVFAA